MKLIRRRAVAIWLLAVGMAAMPVHVARAERLKDLTDILGARRNQLVGYGLVVGLQNTGDDLYAGTSAQSTATMLRQLNVNLDANNLRLRNVAAVMITAEMPAFVAPGQRLDVTVSSVGNARSLAGGTLVASPLKGADLKVYAVAQGPLSVGGYNAVGLTGSQMMKNVTTVGRISGGALVEREVSVTLPTDVLKISLRMPDFTTAVRLATAVDRALTADVGATGQATPLPVPPADANGTTPAAPTGTPGPWSTARDSGGIDIRIPPKYQGQVAQLVALLEAIDVTPDMPNRVVVNERTGTVVLGDSVRLTPVAIAHGGLTLEVREQPMVSQPNAFAMGTTTVVQNTTLNAAEQRAPLVAMAPGASLGEVVRVLNTLAVPPRDLVTILQALKSSGALRAELEVQ